jgi:hypothetical protein
MAPNCLQKAKPSGTSSTKTAEKDQLLEARTPKRTEREEARRVEAESHKEAVCVHILFMPPSLAWGERGKLTDML